TIGGPDLLQNVQVLVGATVPPVVIEIVAVLALIGIAAAGDDVQREPSARKLIESRKLAGGDRGRDKAGPMGQQYAEPLRIGRRVRGNQEAVRSVRVVADEDPVEATALVGLGEVADEIVIEDWPAWGDDLRGEEVRDHPKH